MTTGSIDSATPTQEPTVHELVRDRYAAAAVAASEGSMRSAAQSSCCDPAGNAVFGGALYSAADLSALPEAAALASALFKDTQFGGREGRSCEMPILLIRTFSKFAKKIGSTAVLPFFDSASA